MEKYKEWIKYLRSRLLVLFTGAAIIFPVAGMSLEKITEDGNIVIRIIASIVFVSIVWVLANKALDWAFRGVIRLEDGNWIHTEDDEEGE